jgi:hypothetical protein
MRISGLAVLSPRHLPPAELRTIERLIRSAPITDGRPAIDYHGIAVEPLQYGFFLNTALVLEDEQPVEVSDTLWAILNAAERQGCDWLLIDRDEPVSTDWPLPV